MEPKEQLLQELMNNVTAIRRLMSARISRDANNEQQLPASQAELLMIVHHEGPITLTELAKSMQLTPGAITQLAESLERARLIKRTPSLTDRRVTNVMITTEGQEKMLAMQQHKSNIFKDVYKNLTVEELRIMNNVQKKMIEHLKQTGTDATKSTTKEEE